MVQCILLAFGLLACLSLFLALKREHHANSRKQAKRFEDIFKRLRDASEPSPQLEPAQASAYAPPRSGVNLNNRVHAMRMLRRGEDIGHIAAALGVPRKEVELLIRVQAIGKAKTAGTGSN